MESGCDSSSSMSIEGDLRGGRRGGRLFVLDRNRCPVNFLLALFRLGDRCGGLGSVDPLQISEPSLHLASEPSLS